MPAYINEIISFSGSPNYKLRSGTNKDILTPRIKTNYMKNAFSYQGMEIWNSIPPKIRSVGSIQSFKVRLKEYLLGLQN